MIPSSKTTRLFFLFVSVLLFSSSAWAQQRPDAPNTTPKFRSISVYVSSLPTVANLAMVSMEHTYVKPKVVLGYTYGAFGNLQGLPGDGLGNHATFMVGKEWNKHRLELNLGAAVQWVHFTEPAQAYADAWPIAMVTYRLQIPARKWFFRTGLSTAGLGIGGGYVLQP